MRKDIYKAMKAVTAISVLALILVTQSLFAEGDTAPKKADQAQAKTETVPPQPLSFDKMSKEDIISRITQTLDNRDEILPMVQGLTKEKDANGKAVYKYKGDTLDKVDKETLWKVFGRVQNEATRINMDRLNRQLAQIKQINDANKAARQARPITTYHPPTTPYIPKQPPTTPRPPVQVPKVPSSSNQQGRY